MTAACEQADQVLQRLCEGNRLWASGRGHSWSGITSRATSSLAAVVACSDLPHAPEEVLGTRCGELLVSQVPGPFMCDSVASTVAYGIFELGIRLVLVMGHEGCRVLDGAPGGLASLPTSAVERLALRNGRNARTRGQGAPGVCVREVAACLHRDLPLCTDVRVVPAVLGRNRELQLV